MALGAGSSAVQPTSTTFEESVGRTMSTHARVMEAVLLGLQSRMRICLGAAWAPHDAVVLTMEFERRMRFDVGDDSVDEG